MLALWLPLNGNLDNQGLDNAVITNNGATVDASGKIGSCYSFNGSNSYISIDDPHLYDVIQGGDQPFTIAFWIYHADSTRAIIFGDYGLSGTIAFNVELSTSHYIRFYWNDGNLNKVFNISVGQETWTHIAVVYYGTKMVIYKNGDIQSDIYNGILAKKTKTSGLYFLGKDVRNGATALNGKMNDFRIYDTALSPREIKEISKALVLHYPLADIYIEPTTNLISTEDGLSQTCYNGAISKYGYGTNTDIYKTVTTYDGRKGTKVYMGTNGNRCYPYVYVNNMFVSDGTNSPAYKTLSFDYYGTIGDFLGPYKLGNGNGTATYTVTCQGVKTTGTYNDMGTFAVTPNKWNHVEITFHGTTAADSQWGYIRIAGSHISDTSNFWFFANMQLEANDHATGYAGPNGVRDEDTVYNVSGYGYNGIRNNISWSSDSPKYSGCYEFNGIDSYIRINSGNWKLNGAEEFTVNEWAYADDWTTQTNAHLWSCTEGGGFNTENGGTGKLRFPVNVYTNAEKTAHGYINAGTNNNVVGFIISDLSPGWHMFTAVYNTSGIKTYIDGVLQESTNYTSYGVYYSNATLFLGAESTGAASCTTPYFNGKLSDFRMYYTSLSDSDILALYNMNLLA